MKTAVAPQFKLWLSSPDAHGVFGDGKWRLLRAVRDHGSLAAAAQALHISYRKAWGDLKKAEKHLRVRLIEKHPGGLGGGATRLTEAGRMWLDAYGNFRACLENAVAEAFPRCLGELIQ